MKLRRYFGPTSRAVLEQVRAELGPDAMIVANHASADGIEIMALPADALPQLLEDRPDRAPPFAVPLATGDDAGVTVKLSSRSQEPARGPAAASRSDAANPIVGAGAAMPAGGEDAPRSVDWQAVAALDDPAPRPARSGADAADPETGHAAAAAAGPVTDMAVTDMGAWMVAEMAAMRSFFEEQMTQLAWSDTLRRSPLRSRLTRDLLHAGYSASLARMITERLPDDFNAEEAQAWLAGVLTRNLLTVDPADEIVTRGGTYALIGPTGVGKTTTTAKLAARCAVRYGAGKLALLTTDSYRVGAQDQLRIYARILGVAVHTVSDRHDLRQALESVRGKHLVLIDTVGIGQRDSRVAEQARLLAHPQIERVLLLNAAAQAETLDEVVTTYRRGPDGETDTLYGAIVTKVDEAARTGAVLDIAIRRRLRLQYVTNGQRVPEDLALPHLDYLVDRSLRAAARPSAFAVESDELPLLTSAASLHA
jgi:flagellar biosynthesis protein FlhF